MQINCFYYLVQCVTKKKKKKKKSLGFFFVCFIFWNFITK